MISSKKEKLFIVAPSGMVRSGMTQVIPQRKKILRTVSFDQTPDPHTPGRGDDVPKCPPASSTTWPTCTHRTAYMHTVMKAEAVGKEPARSELSTHLRSGDEHFAL